MHSLHFLKACLLSVTLVTIFGHAQVAPDRHEDLGRQSSGDQPRRAASLIERLRLRLRPPRDRESQSPSPNPRWRSWSRHRSRSRVVSDENTALGAEIQRLPREVKLAICAKGSPPVATRERYVQAYWESVVVPYQRTWQDRGRPVHAALQEDHWRAKAWHALELIARP